MSKYHVEKMLAGISGRRKEERGDKILWLHGYTLDSSCWDEIWQMLPGWHHIGIDLPGHGASAPIAKGSDLRRLAVQLVDFCREQNIRHIVSLSFGTLVALQMAIEFPTFFSSLTLAAPAIAGGPQDPQMAKIYTRLIILYQQQQKVTVQLQKLWMSSIAWQGIETHPALESALSSIVSKHSWQELQSYDRMQQFTSPQQNIDDLTDIQFPVMILLGEYEMPAFRECAAIIEKQVANCKKHELAATYHLCILQSPELSAPLIDSHLKNSSIGHQ